MRTRIALVTTMLGAGLVAALGVAPAQAAPVPDDNSCGVGKYYKICVWSEPNYTGEVRGLGHNVDQLNIGPDFVVRSYQNWHGSDYFIDVDTNGQQHRTMLTEWAQDPNVNEGTGVPVDILGGGNS